MPSLRLPFVRIILTAMVVNMAAAADARAAAPRPDDELHLRTSFGLWGMSAEGSVGARNVESDVDVSFGDILENLNFAVMPGIELSKGNWVFGFNGMLAQLEADETFRDGRGGVVTSVIGIADLSLGYTLVRTELGNGMPLTLTPLVGVRYTYISVELNPNQFETVDRSRDWLDPYVGATAVLGLNEKLDWRTSGTIGGFGVGSDTAWSAATYLDWYFHDNIALNVGYRAVSWDYDDDDFVWDVTFHGPWVGLSFIH